MDVPNMGAAPVQQIEKPIEKNAPTEGKITPIKLGDLGEGTKEATIKKWFVKEGQQIKEFDDLCEVITDKLVAKIPSSVSGIVEKIHLKEDQVCQVGGILLDILTEGKADEPAQKMPEHEQQSKASTPAARPTQSKPAEPNKNILATPAIRNLAKKLNIDLSIIAGTGKEGRITEQDLQNAVKTTGSKPAESNKNILATPAIRNLAKKLNIDLSTIVGTGKGGRITEADIQNATKPKEAPVQKQVEPPKKPVAAQIEAPKAQQASAGDKKVVISGIAKAMTKSMSDLATIPLFNIHDDVCMEGVQNLLKQFKTLYPKDKFSLTPILIKAYSLALTEFPMLNGQVNYQTDKEGYIYEYIQRADHNISVAVATDNGLIVPNLKAVQNKTLLQINKEMRELVERARKGKSTKDDLEGGSFTVSFIGGIGGKAGTPLIFRPQIAIGAVGASRTEAKFVLNANGKYDVVPSDVFTLCMTVDNRVVDYTTGAKFQKRVKQLLEKPELMAFYMK